MTEQQNISLTTRYRGAIRIAIPALLVAAVGASSVWFFTCPCDRTPGGYLLGEVAEAQVTDWSFANSVPLCQIQISGGFLPHSINLNCMSTAEGDLYLSCSSCAGKHWSNAVLDNSSARLRLTDTVYPVTVNRVLDPDELDRAWGARLAKLQDFGTPQNPAAPIGTPRPDGWWSFRVVSR